MFHHIVRYFTLKYDLDNNTFFCNTGHYHLWFQSTKMNKKVSIKASLRASTQVPLIITCAVDRSLNFVINANAKKYYYILPLKMRTGYHK